MDTFSFSELGLMIGRDARFVEGLALEFGYVPHVVLGRGMGLTFHDAVFLMEKVSDRREQTKEELAGEPDALDELAALSQELGLYD